MILLQKKNQNNMETVDGFIGRTYLARTSGLCLVIIYILFYI